MLPWFTGSFVNATIHYEIGGKFLKTNTVQPVGWHFISSYEENWRYLTSHS